MRHFGTSLGPSRLTHRSRHAVFSGAETCLAGTRKVEEQFPSSLAREIHRQLLVLPFFSVFDSITFTLDGKKVTLAGQVVRHTLKDHAEAAVKNIEGVDVVSQQYRSPPRFAR